MRVNEATSRRWMSWLAASLVLWLTACMRPSEEVAIVPQAAAPASVSTLEPPPVPLPPAPLLEPGVWTEPEADLPLPEGSAAGAARSFYRMHMQLHAAGLPVGEDFARYRPLLSKRLLALMAPAARERDRMIAEEPGLKPPYIEGDLFSSLDDGLTGFELGKRSVLGPDRERFEIESVYADSEVSLRRRNRALMVREDGRWKLDDVEYGRSDVVDGDFVAQASLSELLR